MLTQLSIQNIVLIDSCELSFESGLCVLSGETGAGKSILLDSLGLILGMRANAGLVRQGAKQGSVTAEFDITGYKPLRESIEALGLEVDDSLIIRRTLGADGKGRCLINDQPVTVTALKQLGEHLVEIHGQHDQRSLQDSAIQRDMLDSYAGLETLPKKTSKLYEQWNEARKAVAELNEKIAAAAREQDYLQHINKELRALNPQENEEEILTEKRSLMMQSEKLYELLNDTMSDLNQGDGVSANIRSALRNLTRSPLTQTKAFQTVIDGLDKAASDADEAIARLEQIGDSSTYDQAELDATEERLFTLKGASRKYNVPVIELAQLAQDVENKLALIDSNEQELKLVAAKEKETKEAFLIVAKELSEKRQKAAVKIKKSIESELGPLKMESTRFQVRFDRLDEAGWSRAGIDGVHFECATNVSKGATDINYAPLNKIASGGELSRFMLALKVALANTRQAATLIFDEIDTGTGGAVADAIGKRLAMLSDTAQILVVTHLPQVAARGTQHLRVEKHQKAKQVTTSVTALDKKAREEELARMLAGAEITDEARKAAQKLLEQAA